MQCSPWSVLRSTSPPFAPRPCVSLGVVCSRFISCFSFSVSGVFFCGLARMAHWHLGVRRQYEDGTTDVTRTMHFGEATAEQKEVCIKHAHEPYQDYFCLCFLLPTCSTQLFTPNRCGYLACLTFSVVSLVVTNATFEYYSSLRAKLSRVSRPHAAASFRLSSPFSSTSAHR